MLKAQGRESAGEFLTHPRKDLGHSRVPISMYCWRNAEP